MSDQAINTVIFDVGGPLDLEERHELAIDEDIRAGLKREGFRFSEEDWRSANKNAVDTFAPSLYRSVIWRLTSGDTSASRRIYNWLEDRSSQRELFELRPGIRDVLETIKVRGLLLGLAANQPLATLSRLEESGIGGYFQNQA